ncbi:MAG: DUF3467 domain-containing protein [Nitrospinae bacterium]|nr:DUF3467 domain-containing protein [Nitrospinota bacterium]
MDEKEKEKKSSPQFMFEVDRTIENGVYSNIVTISHTRNEFLLDFAIILPGKNGAKVLSRIFMNPAHAKQFMVALGENIKNYEDIYGEIKIDIKRSKVNGSTHTVH